jgi:hypothetical protein
MIAVLIVGSHSVDIRSAPGCPSADQIASQLRPLLPSDRSPDRPRDLGFVDIVESWPDGTVGFHLRLLRHDGTVLGDRRLVLQTGCEEMAEAVASVFAAWETDFQQAPAAERSTSVSIASHPPQTRFRLELGLSAGAAFLGGTALSGGIEAVTGLHASRWQLRIASASETARTLKLDVGEVSWRHTIAAAGLMFRSLGSPWGVSADLDAIIGWATLAGRGYSSDYEQRSFEYGASAGFRVRRSFGRFGVWAEARANLWAKRQRALLEHSSERAELRNWDVMARLGVSATLFP